MDLRSWSVEVRDGHFSAHRWRDAHWAALVEAAVTHGAREWQWIEQPWGLLCEFGFRDDADWDRFWRLPAVSAAIDAVPDRIAGIYVYPGRGGAAGAGLPRRTPRPCGAGAAPLPTEPEPVVVARPRPLEPALS